MLGFVRRAARKGDTLPIVHWDLHAHLLPGVDDGVRTLDDALSCIRALQAYGYRASVLTPHIYRDLYPNSRASLEPVFAQFREQVASAGLTHELRLAAEYFADEHFIELIEREPLLTFGTEAQRFVLIEFAYGSEPLHWADALSALVRAKYTPVLAHVERYRFVTNAPSVWLQRFAQFGVKLQCNIGSLAGQYGREAFEFARQMRDGGSATFWGSDLHRLKQVESYIRPGLSHLGHIELNAELIALKTAVL